MKCLHICNDFSLTKVHSNLYENLDKLNIEQIVYNPTRENTPIGNNKFNFETENSEIIYSKTLKKYHRILFRNKISFLEKDILKKININNISIIHATTLFSDGALAYKLYNKEKIPYIVAVRATDITTFFKYRKDLYFLGLKIIKNASKLIFISDSLKNNFLNHPFIKKHKSEIKKKCVTVYNGIDNYWLDNLNAKNNFNETPLKILYVGRLISRKKIINLANAVINLNKKNINCILNIIGSGGDDEIKLKEISKQNQGVINCLGTINNKEQLKQNYISNDIFAMPSKGETFGLVYIEALSQGLPLLYSKNDGIDGVFNLKIGEKCNGDDILDIQKNIEQMITNHKIYTINQINFEEFRWKNIADKYKNLYYSI